MRNRRIRLGDVKIHSTVLEVIDIVTLGRELDAYARGARATRVSRRRQVVLNALIEYADAVSVIKSSPDHEIWIATSLRRTDVFIPKPVTGRALSVKRVKVCCNPAAARLLTPAEITSAVVRHRRGDWGLVSNGMRTVNEGALYAGGELTSVFGCAEGLETDVRSVPDMTWVSVEVRPARNHN